MLLHNVTVCLNGRFSLIHLGVGPMDKFCKFSFIFMLLALAGGCSSTDNAEQGANVGDNGQEFTQIEAVKGKLDVYTSMARGVKYNIGAASQDMKKKIFATTPGAKATDLIKSVMNSQSQGGNKLYESIRVLDYAVLYALSNLSNDKDYVEKSLYAKAAQNLSLASIKAHKDTLFAEKKIKEINRLMDAEKKKLNAIDAKLERAGRLSSADLSYKKDLEVALLKLREIREAMTASAVEYTKLIKAEPKDLKLEGRMFYELDDMDKKLTVKSFQSSAFSNRGEFSIAKEMGRNYSFKDAEYSLIKKYPEIERMNINGYDVENSVYAENLEQRAYNLALKLAQEVEAYKMADEDKRNKLRVVAFDDLGLAIFTQVELAYNLVRLSEIDYVNVSREVFELKKDIKQKEKAYRLNQAGEASLLNDKIKLFELESKQSQISGEKAIALRALYFYAGFSPFNQALLKGEIKDIVFSLKAAFNKDMVEMLAAVKVNPKEQESLNNNWAKKDNWLEDLMENKPKITNKVEMPDALDVEADFNAEMSADDVNNNVSSDVFAPYTNAAYDKKRVMQLGSYRKKDNADLEWKMLQELYPDFAQLTPEVVKARVNGTTMYRLILRSEKGGFMQICNKLRGSKIECILK